MGSLADPPAPRVREMRIREIVAKQFGCPPLVEPLERIRLDHMNAASEDLVRIADRLAQLLAIEIPDNEALLWCTAADIRDTVERLVRVPGLNDYRPELPDYIPNPTPNPADPRDRSHIPPNLLDTLLRYAGEQRVPPGRFLWMCLENNLSQACSHADDDSLRALPAIARFIYNELPSACWGSTKKVIRWLRREEEEPEVGE